MTKTKARPANFLDAVNAAAKTHRMSPCYDSGPASDGRLLIFGDEECLDDYVNGKGLLGRRIEVSFTNQGTIDRAVETINNEVTARVSAGGDIGSKLGDTLALFSGGR